jgi:hypothetical protein
MSLNDFYLSTTAIENDLNKIISDMSHALLNSKFGGFNELNTRDVLLNVRKAMVLLGRLDFNQLPTSELDQLKQIKDILQDRMESMNDELEYIKQNRSADYYRYNKMSINTFVEPLGRLIESLGGLLTASARVYVGGSLIPRRFL